MYHLSPLWTIECSLLNGLVTNISKYRYVPAVFVWKLIQLCNECWINKIFIGIHFIIIIFTIGPPEIGIIIWSLQYRRIRSYGYAWIPNKLVLVVLMRLLLREVDPGWPDRKQKIHQLSRAHFSYRSTFCGEQRTMFQRFFLFPISRKHHIHSIWMNHSVCNICNKNWTHWSCILDVSARYVHTSWP